MEFKSRYVRFFGHARLFFWRFGRFMIVFFPLFGLFFIFYLLLYLVACDRFTKQNYFSISMKQIAKISVLFLIKQLLINKKSCTLFNMHTPVITTMQFPHTIDVISFHHQPTNATCRYQLHTKQTCTDWRPLTCLQSPVRPIWFLLARSQDFVKCS